MGIPTGEGWLASWFWFGNLLVFFFLFLLLLTCGLHGCSSLFLNSRAGALGVCILYCIGVSTADRSKGIRNHGERIQRHGEFVAEVPVIAVQGIAKSML